MSKQPFEKLPNIPQEIENAAQSGELVVFVGAGISRLVKCPSWDQFADRVLEQIVPKGIDYFVMSQIKQIPDPKKRLSIAKIIAKNNKEVDIDYRSIFKIEVSEENIYSFLNRFNSSFVTTNYDKHLSPESKKGFPEEEWRFFKKEHLLSAKLDQNGTVIHIHGCIDHQSGMIISTEDYLNHYSSPEVEIFLKDLFQKKTVLFLGYGLEEIEILEYMFRRGEAIGESHERTKRFILQGFFNAEKPLFKLLKQYYRESFNTELIAFPKDYRDYYQLEEIIASWSKSLIFRDLTLADEVSAIEDEIVAKEPSPQIRSAIDRAKRTPELQKCLFNKVSGLQLFFPFKDAGFLKPEDIPPPKQIREDGSIIIPVWPVTQYLVSNSSEIIKPENFIYATEFLNFIRNSTKHAKTNNYSNYRVWSHFSKIIQKIPAKLLSIDDVDLIDYWLEDKYERGAVAENIGEWIVSIINSNDDKISKKMALSLLEVLYKTKILEENHKNYNETKTSFRFNQWYADRITKKIVAAVGNGLRIPGVSFFQTKLENILKEQNNDQRSYIWRPAIENHEQNFRIHGAEYTIIEALRDSLFAFIEINAPDEVHKFVSQMLDSEYQIIKRIAICAIDKYYIILHGLVNNVLIEDCFTNEFRHELWLLINNQYLNFSEVHKKQVYNVISDLKCFDDNGQINKRATAYNQAIWFSAINNFNDNLKVIYDQCVEVIGKEPDHPDFSNYMSVGSVNHKSPLSMEELLSLETDQLINVLDSYQDSDDFGESGFKGLVAAFHQIIKAEPARFYLQLSKFSQLDIAYVHEIIEAYRELWSENAILPWEEIWKNLLLFCKSIIQQDRFWAPENMQQRKSFVANRYWVIRQIAKLIENGTNSDENAFPEEYLQVAEQIIAIILKNEKGEEFRLDSDAVSIAINSPRGHALEALINITLRKCRLADKHQGNHSKTWAQFQTIYDSELLKADCNEFEFVTLVANYFPQFMYMSKDWFFKNLEVIFDISNHLKWICAIQGYSYVNVFYVDIYKFLKDRGYILRILDDETINENVHRRIIENIAFAYVNDIEIINKDNSIINQMVARGKKGELDSLISNLREYHKKNDESVRKKIFELWQLIFSNLDTKTKDGRQLAGRLCEWMIFINEIDADNKKMIFEVIQYADENYNSYEVLKTISRITKRQPFEGFEIWSELLKYSQPDYPEEEIKKALKNLLREKDNGIRMAKEIVSLYLKVGNDEPYVFLNDFLKSPVS